MRPARLLSCIKLLVSGPLGHILRKCLSLLSLPGWTECHGKRLSQPPSALFPQPLDWAALKGCFQRVLYGTSAVFAEPWKP